MALGLTCDRSAGIERRPISAGARGSAHQPTKSISNEQDRPKNIRHSLRHQEETKFGAYLVSRSNNARELHLALGAILA
jgi:hypothetical protein